VSLASAQKMRVLFVTSSLNLGGAERQLLMLCANLETKVDVQIVSLESEGPLKEKYLNSFPGILFLNEENPLRQINKLRKIIRISKPDVVVTWLYRADLLGGIAAKLAGDKPVIWSARNSAIPNFSNSKKILLSICSRIIPRVIVANGTPAYNFHTFIGYPSKKLVIIPNLLAPWTSGTRSKSKLLHENVVIDKLRIGIAARQVSGKGIIETIDIVARLSQECPAIELLLIGQDSEESQEWKAKNLYRGHLVESLDNDRDVMEWFSNLDVYLMASTSWESQPNSLIEAVAIGCPALVSDRIQLDPRMPPLMRFDPTSKLSFEESLRGLLLKSPEEIRVLTASARKSLLSSFSGHSVCASWIKLISQTQTGV
jgi:glycosyltransferase involved in cell wall biosynthesis